VKETSGSKDGIGRNAKITGGRIYSMINDGVGQNRGLHMAAYETLLFKEKD